jgi:hypothetical protein
MIVCDYWSGIDSETVLVPSNVLKNVNSPVTGTLLSHFCRTVKFVEEVSIIGGGIRIA